MCAQLYKWNALKAETVFRIFEPPLLLAKSFNANIASAIKLDHADVALKGVVIASFRARRASA